MDGLTFIRSYQLKHQSYKQHKLKPFAAKSTSINFSNIAIHTITIEFSANPDELKGKNTQQTLAQLMTFRQNYFHKGEKGEHGGEGGGGWGKWGHITQYSYQFQVFTPSYANMKHAEEI